MSIGSQTPIYLSDRTPRKLKFKRELSEAHRSIKDLEKRVSHLSEMLAQTNSVGKCVQLCEEYLPQSLFMLVKNCLNNKDKDPRRHRFSTKIK